MAMLDVLVDDEYRPVVPVTEAHLIAFVGRLATERTTENRSVQATSIPQYISAVRQMHLSLLGIPVPKFPFVKSSSVGLEGPEGQRASKRNRTMRIPLDTAQNLMDSAWKLRTELY